MSHSSLDRFYKYHRRIQRCIDVSVPLGCAFAQLIVVFKLGELPPSIVAAFGGVTPGYWWSFLSFISYIAIIIGIILRPNLEDIIDQKGFRQKLGDLYVFFEYPGLVAASTFTFIYAGALITYFGIFSPSAVAIGFSISIGIYFFFRTLRFALELKISEVQVCKKRKSLGD